MPLVTTAGRDLAAVDQTALAALPAAQKAAPSGVASLDGSSLVVQDPVNAVTTATGGKIVKRDGSGDVLVPAAPSSANAAVGRDYVNNFLQGLDLKASVRAATTANLVATRVGSILTADANGALPAIDGVALIVTDRVLVKNQVTGADNGIYTVTDLGSGGTPYVFTRASDADVSADVTTGMFSHVEEGATQARQRWALITAMPIVLNTTALVFTRISALGEVVAGDGVDKTGDTIAAATVVSAAPQKYGALVKDRTSDGTGAAGADAGFLAVKTDDVDIRVNAANELELKSKAAANGLATLDAATLLPTGQLPVEVPRWRKFTIGLAALQALGAVSTADLEVYSLPAGGTIHSTKVKHFQALASVVGPLTAATASVGKAGNLTKYATVFDVFQAVSGTAFGIFGVVGSENHGAATSIRVEIVLTGDTFDNLTAGVIDVWLLVGTAL